MSVASIGNMLEAEQNDGTRVRPVVEEVPPSFDNAGRMPHGYPEYNKEEVPSDSRLSGTSYLGDVLDAQQQLISAQHMYLHDNDPAKLLRAQLSVINVYNGVLDRLGVFG